MYPCGGEGSFTLYEDTGDGFEHKTGTYARQTISCRSTNAHVKIEVGERDGSLEPTRTSIVLEICGIASAASAEADAMPIEMALVKDGMTIMIPERGDRCLVKICK